METGAVNLKMGVIVSLLLAATPLLAQQQHKPEFHKLPGDSLQIRSQIGRREGNIDRMPIYKPDLSKVIPMPQLKMEKMPSAKMPVYPPKPIPRLRFELLSKN